jgi:tRNA nucleotidyltransferase (CCA-adding enzyme)
MSTSGDPRLAALRAAVPATVREVCSVLTGAGHQAVTVGGAVRDALLGRAPGDWDVASSARPEEVIALFRRTIPTGLQHGTVTVMVGRGEDRLPVEVTTFRGEGAYSDARRPDHVVFGVPLTEDLARRDLRINAIAYDPERDELIDPFDGQADLAARVVRAVGDPVARFTEDGLRVMRAIRFAAVLEFGLDAETEAALTVALPSLAKVSRERVHDELDKLLAARVPSQGLAVAARAGVMAQILPELAGGPVTWARVDAAPRAVRLGALFAAVPAKTVDVALRRLKYSNEDRVLAVALAGLVIDASVDAVAVRRGFARAGATAAAAAVPLWTARAAAGEGDHYARAAQLGAEILARGDAFELGQLALTGGDLMSELAIPAGKPLGELLRALLEAAIVDPAVNTRDGLLALARARAGGGLSGPAT